MKYSESKHSLIKQLLLWTVVLIFAFLQMRNDYANRLNSKACQTDNLMVAKTLLKKAIKFNPSNPLYYANLGLSYAHSDSTLLTIHALISGRSIKSVALDSAILFFEKAASKVNNEHSFLLNIGLLYAFKGEQKRAISYLTSLVDNSGSVTPALLSLGILNEYLRDKAKAKYFYKQALCHSPALLDSPFYADLCMRDSVLSETILCEVEESLNNDYIVLKDPIIAAKLGKVKLYKKEYEQAERYLCEAVRELPSLNRPWVYLGNIAEIHSNTAKAVTCYKKAELLDKNDLLPIYYLSRFDIYYMDRIKWMQQYSINEQSKILQYNYNASFSGLTIVIEDFMKYIELDFVKVI